MIFFTGDINLTDNYFDTGFGIGSKLTKQFDPFQYIVRKEDDVWVGNFEGVSADVTNKKGTAAKHFRVPPEYLEHLCHLDLYGFANNHAMQHGARAYRQTIATLEGQGSKVFGSNDCRSIIIEHQGRKVSLTGFSQRIDTWKDDPQYWHNPEYKEIEKEISRLSADAFKVIYVHWGNEFINYPSSSQKLFAHWLVDAGFDLVIGMHPHILQGCEVYNGKYIYYSLGNFVFDMAWEPTHYGAVVTLDFSQLVAVVGYRYVKIGEDYAPRIVEESEVPDNYRFSHLNVLINKEENSEEYHIAINRFYKQYRKANHKDIIKKMVRHPSNAIGTINDFIKRRL